MRDFSDITTRILISTVKESLESAGVEVGGIGGEFCKTQLLPRS